MTWNSPADFLAMGGYALYVWGSLGACVLAIVVEIVALRARRRAALAALRRRLRAASSSSSSPPTAASTDDRPLSPASPTP